MLLAQYLIHFKARKETLKMWYLTNTVIVVQYAFSGSNYDLFNVLLMVLEGVDVWSYGT
uniref:Uncharacterized protein n=1 Tax=Amphimedon queenslandica TaxID=400682 RepID=A0A1X7VHK4_AMPQE